MKGPSLRLAALLIWTLLSVSCQETFSAGTSKSHTLLPVDERNPIVLINDSARDNLQGEYAILLSNSGGPKLVAIFVDTSGAWRSIEANKKGWWEMVDAARAANLQVPDPQTSTGASLNRPSSGIIEETEKNGSEAAHFIVNESKNLSLPYRPLVVVTGTRLTDVADAYLIDKTVVDRVVVVSSLGQITTNGDRTMYVPNGEMDPWADTIVASRFRYIQVSAYYLSKNDLPEADLSTLPPDNEFCAWLSKKRATLSDEAVASDQVAVAAGGIPGFVTEVERVMPEDPTDAGTSSGPRLLKNENGKALLVRAIAPEKATERFWKALLDPKTFKQ